MMGTRAAPTKPKSLAIRTPYFKDCDWSHSFDHSDWLRRHPRNSSATGPGPASWTELFFFFFFFSFFFCRLSRSMLMKRVSSTSARNGDYCVGQMRKERPMTGGHWPAAGGQSTPDAYFHYSPPFLFGRGGGRGVALPFFKSLIHLFDGFP